MDYNFIELKISDLVGLIDKELVDLNPSYQRNYIWSPNDQKQLIDTILDGFPLPNFFLYEKPDGKYEMVDGQQRSKTIYRFVKGQITSSKNKGNQSYNATITNFIDNYRIAVIKLSNLKAGENLNDFYVLINKKGVKVNSPEVNKSEFHDSIFMRLANDVLGYQALIDLNLFTEAVSKRMNDRAFIEELLAYLKFGIKDKKDSVEYIYGKEDFSEEEFIEYKKRFISIINVLSELNSIYDLKNTRYRQKNDFFTLFCFINSSFPVDLELLKYQYEILLVLDRKDDEGLQFIRPSNDNCLPLKEYAINCVSQSNSANARKNRLMFFNSILKYTLGSPSENLDQVIDFLEDIYNIDIPLKKVHEFDLIDLSIIPN
ncbi:DUF262 domain-containing protein [Algoriphagus persicinus]|uniref:DUF262 domain-containing protein n=1 Tax=Algoriphagus persicinus TaxID=3108754 RepID=UPI002B392CD8|nr:DUF262 domain-containing protein [Algoriphagus sp. E1-3-M2]MEB2786816.1 DUF262 domain-containing protein [Algoriphagus sp. E1-3-M2]